MMKTLVLDHCYLPICAVSWERAVTLLLAGRAELVEAYDHQVHSPSLVLDVPSIVRLTAMRERGKRRRIKFSRPNVYDRDRGRCRYCGVTMELHEATYDHILPRARGGRTSWENVVLCCEDCNQRKGNRTPEEAQMPLLSRPFKPSVVIDPLRLHPRTEMPASWAQWLSS